MASTSEMGSADFETLVFTSDVELLKRGWHNEKAAPEILQYEAALVDIAKEQIELVEETIEEYVEDGIDPLVVSLYQMDLDRTQFLRMISGVLVIWKSILKRVYWLSCPRIISRFSSNPLLAK